MSTTDTDLFSELRLQADRLNGLLADPHPGLFTWMGAVSHCCLSIGDLGGVGRVSAMPDLLAACKNLEERLTPYKGRDVTRESTYICGRTAVQRLRAAIINASTKGVPPDA